MAGTILNIGASIDVSDFGLIIIAIGKSLLASSHVSWS
jgi:hypothetical protein